MGCAREAAAAVAVVLSHYMNAAYKAPKDLERKAAAVTGGAGIPAFAAAAASSNGYDT